VTPGHSESLEIRSDVSELERIFAFIDPYCGRAGIPDSVKYKLFLVAEELTMNAISHGYDGRSDGRIAMVLTRLGPNVELYFEDEAPAFNVLRDASDPDLEASVADRRIGGLGVHLLKSLSRSATYAYERGCNVVRVTFADEPASAEN
jgi:anti-sigma regulatory factor (Ser/Thr protein kinase)